MSHWELIRWSALFLGGVVALYGLHRLALHLEAQGHLYYLHRKPKGGSMLGGLVAFQKAIEPSTEHVLRVGHAHQATGEEGVPSPGPEPGGESDGSSA